MLRSVAVLIIAATLTSCSAEAPQPSSAQRVARVCPPVDDGDYYFHPDVALLPARFGDRERRRLSNYLRTLQADSLSCGDEERETYRMLYVQEASGMSRRLLKFGGGSGDGYAT